MSRRAFGSGIAPLAVLCVAGLTPAMAAEQARATAYGQPATTGHLTVPITSGGQVREVKIFIPGNYDGRQAIPLMFDLHGSNGSGAEQAVNSDMATTAQKHGFVVAWPDGGITLPRAPEAHYWNITGLPLTGNTPAPANTPDEVQFFSDAIDQLASRFCIDLQRVYAVGHSGGGRMSSLLACQLADRIAAVAPVVGLRAGPP